ncbi:hypothetical protein [Burkholderia oklahomensis]|uniref:hypothetical protein n=1 Tax=Burkholderia oklahomensis TaxID=342113 RepID=UPI0012FD33CC|nr:hypothetical protein [Burkholderia oklahomensis]
MLDIINRIDSLRLPDPIARTPAGKTRHAPPPRLARAAIQEAYFTPSPLCRPKSDKLLRIAISAEKTDESQKKHTEL